jgi:GntR family transcriptional regulator
MSTPFIRIDLSLPEPAYLQIADQIRARLVAGDLRPGDRLPPVRQLAADLHVHHNTVAQAYRELAREGWLELRPGRGARVRTRPAAAAGLEQAVVFSRQLEGLFSRAAAAGLGLEQVMREARAVAKKLWKGDRR